MFAATQAGAIVVTARLLYAVIDAGDARNRYTQIMRYATDGSSSVLLVGMAGTVGRMAIRGADLYFAHVDDSTVYRVCK